MTDREHVATVKAVDPKGNVNYITKTGPTLEEAQRQAVRWGVAYYLYDNGHITGQHSAKIAAEQADRMNKEGRVEYDGFAFEFTDAPEPAGV